MMGAVLPPAFTLVEKETTHSTNDDAAALIANGAATDGTIIVAAQQTGGRGRLARTWQSPPGNLYASFIIRSQYQANVYNLITSVAVANAVADFLPTQTIHCKWPNDVLLGQKKMAGILLEQQGDFLIIGLGVNVAHYPSDTLFPATSMAAYGASVSAGPFLQHVCTHFQDLRRRFASDGLAPIRALWLQRAYQLHNSIAVHLPDRTEQGVFSGLADDGALLLQQGDSVIPIHAADIFGV